MFGHKRVPSREGGVEIVVEELASRMVERGHNVLCINRKGHHVSGSEFDIEKMSSYKGINLCSVITLDKKGLAAITSSFFAAIKASFRRYDIVNIHAEGPAAMSFIPKLFGKKVIVTIHGLDWARAKWGRFARKYIKFGEIQAVKNADQIIVLSRAVQKYFKDTYNRDTVYIPNGIVKPQKTTVNAISERWNLKKDSYVLYLGRIVPEKGIHYLIKAWKSIATDKTLVIAGGCSDSDSYMLELKIEAKELKNVIFTGFVQGRILEELYSNAYIYVLPSDLEGMPLSLLEAMSYGNCCLTSDISECKEVAEENALYFSHGNIKDLQDQLQYLLCSPEVVYSYKEHSSEFITSKYNWDVVVDKIISLY